MATPRFNNLHTTNTHISIRHKSILQKQLENVSSLKTPRGRPIINGTEAAHTELFDTLDIPKPA